MTLTNEQICAGAAVMGDHGKPIGRNVAIAVFDAMTALALPEAPQEPEPTSPDAWMKERTGDCVSAATKAEMEQAKFGLWSEVAKQYTRPLYFSPAAPALRDGATRLDILSLVHSLEHSAYQAGMDGDELDPKYVRAIDNALRAFAGGEHSALRAEPAGQLDAASAAPVLARQVAQWTKERDALNSLIAAATAEQSSDQVPPGTGGCSPELPPKLTPTHCADGFPYGYTDEQMEAFGAQQREAGRREGEAKADSMMVTLSGSNSVSLGEIERALVTRQPVAPELTDDWSSLENKLVNCILDGEVEAEHTSIHARYVRSRVQKAIGDFRAFAPLPSKVSPVEPTPEAYKAAKDELKYWKQKAVDAGLCSGLAAPVEPVIEDGGRTMSEAEFDVLAERQRQISKEGWSQAHDDEHEFGVMSEAAACYITGTMEWSSKDQRQRWPWSHCWWKPKDSRKNLVRAAALVIAEIERLDRRAAILAQQAKPTGGQP